MSSAPSSSRLFRLACVVAAAIGFSSCKSTQNGGSGSPYASSEGGYNPYPNGGGAAQNGSLLAPGAQPKYAEAPPPPPPGFDGPSGDFQEMPRKHSTSSGSGSSKTKSKSTGSTASSSGGGKKKGASSATSSKGGYVASGGTVHTVKAGDTLFAIADHNHTTVAKLKALNHLKSNSLKVGQKIKVK